MLVGLNAFKTAASVFYLKVDFLDTVDRKLITSDPFRALYDSMTDIDKKYFSSMLGVQHECDNQELVEKHTSIVNQR